MTIVLFYTAAFVALMAAALVISGTNAVHALLFMVAALLALALIFVLYDAPFAAALQVIVYAGAIMVMFVFVIMMLNLGAAAVTQEQAWLAHGSWRLPGLFAGVLLLELLLLLPSLAGKGGTGNVRRLGAQLFGPYLIAVEAASLLLLAGLVAAWHLGRVATEEA